MKSQVLEKSEEETNSSRKPSNSDYLGQLKVSALEAFGEGSQGLKQIENRISSQLGSDAKQITEISKYLLSLGGKRIRPLLSVLSYKLFTDKELSSELIDAAAGIELIHMATLLHDDIIDASKVRRRQASAFVKYGLTPSLLTGDFLLVRAFGLCAHLDLFIIEETERACIELTEGEILEGKIDTKNPISFDDYLDIIGKKTASLFSLSTAVGAHLSTKDSGLTKQLKDFGLYSGLAFQMIDDILDVTADEDLLGKPSGTDLKQQTPSLINILWLESKDEQARDFFEKENPTLEEAKQQISRIKEQGVIRQSRKVAKEYAAKATDSLNQIDATKINSNIKNKLISLVEYTLERCL